MEKIVQKGEHILGDNIRRLRKEKGIRSTQVVCSLQLFGVDVSTSTYSKLERGTCNPTVRMLMALSEIYQCGYDEFFKTCGNGEEGEE